MENKPNLLCLYKRGEDVSPKFYLKFRFLRANFNILRFPFYSAWIFFFLFSLSLFFFLIHFKKMTFPIIDQTTTPLLPYQFSVPDKQALVKQYVGKSLHQVRTPRLVVDRAVVQKNCEKLGDIAQRQQVKIRIHVKTHKTIEATAIELETAGTNAIVVSTLAEAYYLIQSPLVANNQLTDVLLGLPISPDKFDDMFALADQVETFSIFIGK